MSAIESYAARYDRPADNNFAAACYDQNTVQELIDALAAAPDATDCKTWGITPEEWGDAVYAALCERVAEMDMDTPEPSCRPLTGQSEWSAMATDGITTVRIYWIFGEEDCTTDDTDRWPWDTSIDRIVQIDG